MIRYAKKIRFLRVYENWFQYRYSFEDALGFNAYWNVKKKDVNKVPGIKKKSHTVELDLEQEADIIFGNFSKQIRQQIKLAENEGVICTYQHDINRFVEFFNEFAKKKNTTLVSQSRMQEFGNGITLSFAIHNGVLLAAHSYLIDKDAGIVRHHHSATRRLDDNIDRNLIGRANKYLTVKNILRFKQEGYKIFDFGGYAKDTEDESLKGINAYKLLFGGKVVECENYFSYGFWFIKKVSSILGLGNAL